MENGEKYEKFQTWVMKSFVDIELLDYNKKTEIYSINTKYHSYIKELLEFENVDSFIREENDSVYIKTIKNKKTNERNSKFVEEVKARDNFKCFFNKDHKSFISNSTKKQYVECHHIIPIGRQNSFEKKLDDKINIIALCPNCHRKIHFAINEEKEECIKYMYQKIKSENFINNFEENDLKELYI